MRRDRTFTPAFLLSLIIHCVGIALILRYAVSTWVWPKVEIQSGRGGTDGDFVPGDQADAPLLQIPYLASDAQSTSNSMLDAELPEQVMTSILSDPAQIAPEIDPSLLPPEPNPWIGIPIPTEHRRPAFKPKFEPKGGWKSQGETSGGGNLGGGAGTIVSDPSPLAHNPAPKYPLESRRKKQEGTVRLSIVILATGKVSQISIAESSGFPLLDQSALDAVAHYQFSPAIENGTPVDCQFLYPIRFQLARK